MSESEKPSAPGPFDPPPESPGAGVSPFGAGTPSLETPPAPPLYPLGRPPRSPFAEESPRLGIIHFLVAMTGVAILLGMRQFGIDLQRTGGPPRDVPVAITVYETINGIGSGLALASLGLAVARWRRRQSYPVWPGEWLLLNAGLSTAVWFSLWMVMQLTLEDRQDFSAMRWYYVACVLLPLPLHTLAAVRVRIRPWRVYFTVSALASLLGASLFAMPDYWMSFNCINIADIPRVALLLIATVGDVAHRRQLPWTHWFGAGLLTSLLAFSTAWSLLMRWFI